MLKTYLVCHVLLAVFSSWVGIGSESRGGDKDSGPCPLWVRIPEKSLSHQASIQNWAFIGTPAKRHLMAFRWRADDDPLIVVFGSSLLPPLIKNIVKVGPPSDKTIWIRTCSFYLTCYA